jgi:hypothetical protein
VFNINSRFGELDTVTKIWKMNMQAFESLISVDTQEKYDILEISLQ